MGMTAVQDQYLAILAAASCRVDNIDLKARWAVGEWKHGIALCLAELGLERNMDLLGLTTGGRCEINPGDVAAIAYKEVTAASRARIASMEVLSEARCC